MRLHLIGFRCHTNYIFDIKDNTLVLIKGPSGVGKSTILQALAWVLYGKMQHITSAASPTQCAVRLDCTYGQLERKDGTSSNTEPNLIIYRQNKPSVLLQVKYNGVLEVDAAAQATIEQLFNTRDMWLTCSYILQGSRCHFFNLSALEKMSLLNLLSFSTDNPEDKIERIEAKTTEAKQAFDATQSAFNFHHESFMKTYNTLMTNIVTTGFTFDELRNTQPSLLRADIERHVTELNKIMYQAMEYRRNIESKHELSRELDAIAQRKTILAQQLLDSDALNGKKIHLASIDEMIAFLKSRVNVSGLTSQLSQLTSMMSSITDIPMPPELRLDIEKLANEIHQLDKKITSLPRISREQVEGARRTESQYAEMEQKCKQLGIEYKSDVIASRRSALQAILDKQPILQAMQQANTLAQIISTLPQITDTEISAIQSQIYQLSQSLDIHRCPHCEKPLRMAAGKITKADTAPSSKEDICVLQQQLTQAQERRANRQKKETELSWIVDNVKKMQVHCPISADDKLLSHEEYAKLQRELDILRTINSNISLPQISSAELMQQYTRYEEVDLQRSKLMNQKDNKEREQQWIQKQNEQREYSRKEMERKIAALQQEINAHTTVSKNGKTPREIMEQKIRDLALERNTCAHEISNQEKIRLNLEVLARQSQETIVKLTAVEAKILVDPTNQETALRSEKEKLEKKLIWVEQVYRIIEQHASLSKYQQDVLAKNEAWETLQSLKNKAIDVEHRLMQHTVENLNMVLSEVAPMLFDDPIEITVELFRTAKTTGRTKPSVNIKINYRGTERDSLVQVSGGEADRISIALMLAFARMNSSPFILLDEAMAGLDNNIKEMCLKALRSKLFSCKTILIIGHDGVEGYYDSTVDLG